MLTLRKCLIVTSPLKSYAMLSTKVRSSRKPVRLKGRDRSTRLPEARYGPNPGVELQVSTLGLNDNDVRNPELLDDMEKQFWDVDKIQDSVDRERHIQKELLSIFQVTRKQFKEEKSPNMLTWGEKQEIKTLHAQDPEKWTVMRLAYSYPASPTVIKKVLKTKWRLKTQGEIEKHDQRVVRNWEALSTGNLHVPDDELKKHLVSFTDRSKILSTSRKDPMPGSAEDEDKAILKDVLKDGGVFGNIYQSYKEESRTQTGNNSSNTELVEKEATSVEAGLTKLYHPPLHDTFIIPMSVQNVKLRTSKPVSLGQMRDKVLHDFESQQSLSVDERSFIQTHLEKNSYQASYNNLKDPIGLAPKSDDQLQDANDCRKESIQDKLEKLAGYSKKTNDDHYLHHKSSRDDSVHHQVSSEEIRTNACGGNSTQNKLHKLAGYSKNTDDQIHLRDESSRDNSVHDQVSSEGIKTNASREDSIQNKLQKLAGYPKKTNDDQMHLPDESSLLDESSHDNPIYHPVTSELPTKNDIERVPKSMKVSKVSPYHDQENKELLASFKTARMDRSKIDDDTIVKVVKNFISSSSESYPLEISIPKDLWKEGALYRVKDRFYTDDGEFLFRVPGLVKE